MTKLVPRLCLYDFLYCRWSYSGNTFLHSKIWRLLSPISGYRSMVRCRPSWRSLQEARPSAGSYQRLSWKVMKSIGGFLLYVSTTYNVLLKLWELKSASDETIRRIRALKNPRTESWSVHIVNLCLLWHERRCRFTHTNASQSFCGLSYNFLAGVSDQDQYLTGQFVLIALVFWQYTIKLYVTSAIFKRLESYGNW